jgi:hypothetical protein
VRFVEVLVARPGWCVLWRWRHEPVPRPSRSGSRLSGTTWTRTRSRRCCSHLRCRGPVVWAVLAVSGACAAGWLYGTVGRVSLSGPLPSTLLTEEFVDGPWRCAFWVQVPFAIRSKSNFRRYAPGVSSGEWREYQAFERGVAAAVRSVIPASWQVPDPAVRLAVRPQVAAFVAAKSRLDSANFSKSVLDACEGLLFVSDASVQGTGSLAVRGSGSCFALAFAQLDPGAEPSAMQAAQAGLATRVLERFTFS